MVPPVAAQGKVPPHTPPMGPSNAVVAPVPPVVVQTQVELEDIDVTVEGVLYTNALSQQASVRNQVKERVYLWPGLGRTVIAIKA